ncbi:MAG: patatin-like phospholipase family protein [Bacteroidia bacterium]|nr:patatin-like phospholipase family protein [Bacteroidia bacterium]MDW8159220.1 patatin-like phospholipase family protein [Bacteroidia bacterium]
MGKSKKIALALQGGGSHGAFTWGVLGRFLEEEDIEIAAIAGTSAGAINAAVMAYGLQIGGRREAKEKLEELWEKIIQMGSFWPLKPTWWDQLTSFGSMLTSPIYWFSTIYKSIVSPYYWNPFNFNPLRTILQQVIDFEKLKAGQGPDLFICATNVKRCCPCIFYKNDISVEVLLASACVPTFFQAVEIQGEAYWDGGFMGNPPLFPILRKTDIKDILLVKINPIRITKVPKTMPEIEDRMNEISFNSSLIWELNWIYFVNTLVKKKGLPKSTFREIFLHAISADEELADLDYSSKLNIEPGFIYSLKSLGWKYANTWLKENKVHIGNKSTFNLADSLWLIEDFH